MSVPPRRGLAARLGARIRDANRRAGSAPVERWLDRVGIDSPTPNGGRHASPARLPDELLEYRPPVAERHEGLNGTAEAGPDDAISTPQPDTAPAPLVSPATMSRGAAASYEQVTSRSKDTGGAGSAEEGTLNIGREHSDVQSDVDEHNALDHLLLVLRRRWRLVLVCLVLTTAAAVIFSALQRAEYTASSSLLFRNTQFDQQLFGTNFTPIAVDPTRDAATNNYLVSLPIVSGRTAAELHLPAGLVGSELSVSGIGQANVAKISVTDPDPRRAAQIANVYAQQYVLFRQQADRAKLAAAQALVNHKLAALPRAQRFGSIGNSLQNRGNELGVMAELQTGNAEVVQPAGVPSSPSSPKTQRNGVLGGLLGLLLGIFAAFIAERLDRRFRDPAELEQAYRVPLLGAVPDSPAYGGAGSAPLPPIEAEAFALLRARLRYFNVDRDVRSLLVTSSQPGEGKTTVALNLAIAEALAGDPKVVLVEADLRRPALAGRLGIRPVFGVAEILSRNATLEDAATEIHIPGREPGATTSFTVITAGAIPPNPSQLIESRAMIELLSELSTWFNLVIIDSPPVSVVSDAIPMMRLVNGVLIVSRIDTSTRDAARHLHEQLRKLKAPVLGVVANATSAKGRGYYGYGYYGNGASPNGDVPSAPPETVATGSTLDR